MKMLKHCLTSRNSRNIPCVWEQAQSQLSHSPHTTVVGCLWPGGGCGEEWFYIGIMIAFVLSILKMHFKITSEFHVITFVFFLIIVNECESIYH